jgi:predicted nucleotidyltransferase
MKSLLNGAVEINEWGVVDIVSRNNLIEEITRAVFHDRRIVFAYLYGSFCSGDQGNDIDIAVYSIKDEDPHQLAADLKIDLYHRTGLPPDRFDVRVLNDFDEHCDLFALLYLKNILESGRLLVDKSPDLRANFLELYGTRFRECEGLIQEILA